MFYVFNKKNILKEFFFKENKFPKFEALFNISYFPVHNGNDFRYSREFEFYANGAKPTVSNIKVFFFYFSSPFYFFYEVLSFCYKKREMLILHLKTFGE